MSERTLYVKRVNSQWKRAAEELTEQLAALRMSMGLKSVPDQISAETLLGGADPVGDEVVILRSARQRSAGSWPLICERGPLLLLRSASSGRWGVVADRSYDLTWPEGYQQLSDWLARSGLAALEAKTLRETIQIIREALRRDPLSE